MSNATSRGMRNQQCAVKSAPQLLAGLIHVSRRLFTFSCEFRSHTGSCNKCFSLLHRLSLCLFLSLSLSRTHTHTLSLTHVHSHRHTHTHTLSFTHIHSHRDTHTHHLAAAVRPTRFSANSLSHHLPLPASGTTKLVDGRLGSRLRGYHPVAPRPLRYGPFVHRL
jgi:hypothetical protein